MFAATFLTGALFGATFLAAWQATVCERFDFDHEEWRRAYTARPMDWESLRPQAESLVECRDVLANKKEKRVVELLGRPTSRARGYIPGTRQWSYEIGRPDEGTSETDSLLVVFDETDRAVDFEVFPERIGPF